MMMLVHDEGYGIKSLMHPLIFLLINLGTASEILSNLILSYLSILSYQPPQISYRRTSPYLTT